MPHVSNISFKHVEGARIYGFSDFEGAVQSVVAKGLKRGQFGR
jgi:hypothetical protein